MVIHQQTNNSRYLDIAFIHTCSMCIFTQYTARFGGCVDVPHAVRGTDGRRLEYRGAEEACWTEPAESAGGSGACGARPRRRPPRTL